MKKILVFTALLFMCYSCKEGAESLSELSVSIFNAIKANDFNALLKTAPSQKAMSKYLELYEFNKFSDASTRKEEASNRTTTANATLKKEFTTLMAALKESVPDWSKAKLSDYKYEVNDTKEGFHQAIMKLIITSKDKVTKVQCNALQVADRWFLVPGMSVGK